MTIVVLPTPAREAYAPGDLAAVMLAANIVEIARSLTEPEVIRALHNAGIGTRLADDLTQIANSIGLACVKLKHQVRRS